MAIKPFQKLSLIVHQNALDEAMAVLQSSASVQIVGVPSPEDQQSIQARFRKPSGIGEVQDRLSELEHCITLLGEYQEPLKGLDSLFTQRIAVTSRELEELVRSYNVEAILTELGDAENQLRQMNSEQDDLYKTRAILEPWTSLPIGVQALHQFEHVSASFCAIPRKSWNEISSNLSLPEISDYVICSESEKDVFVLFIYARTIHDSFRKWMEERELEELSLPQSSLPPKEQLDRISQEVQEIDVRIKELNERIRSKVPERPRLMVYRDHLASVQAKKMAEGNLLETDRTAFLIGWLRSDKAEEVKKRLEQTVGVFHWDLQDPEPTEEPPVVLETADVVEPFQMVTSLYGLPDYREIDPTPYIAPTFALFFGICMSDVGYGLIIALVTWLAMKKLPLEPVVRQAMKVLFWGGVATA
ncbi:MAG TPA: V-type ATPase 116kDa subunit family protein, partial [bacterium]|nr:V-type ATPase 116kDa subunit family protein [bacterium]